MCIYTYIYVYVMHIYIHIYIYIPRNLGSQRIRLLDEVSERIASLIPV
jgi:hypothetical protein